MELIQYPIDTAVDLFFQEAEKQGFERREGQIEMAKDVCKAVSEKKPLVVEAEVGIGKSFAYLVPIIIQYFRERRQIVIATSTIALQEQLYRDAQTILGMLGVKANVILAKGMTNYACMQKVSKYRRNHRHDFQAENAWKEVLAGRQDRSEMQMPMSDALWDELSISSIHTEKCKKCPYARYCRYSVMRNELKTSASIVISNQNMLVAHLTGKEIFSPSLSTIVVDEAHNLEPKFRDAYTTAYSEHELRDVLENLKEAAPEYKRAKATLIVQKAKNALELLFRELRFQIRRQQKHSDGDATAFFFQQTDDVKECLKALGTYFTLLGRISEKDVKAWSTYFHRCLNAADLCIVWAEKTNRFRLCVCRKDVSPYITQVLFQKDRSTILTSATLTDNDSESTTEQYAYFLNSIGFPKDGMVSEPKKSPYDYLHQARLYCAQGMPYPKQDNRDLYRMAAVDRIVELLNVTEGKTLILFTARKDMEYVYKRLSNLHLPYRILMQNSASSQKRQLSSFKDDVHSVILGTGTYWEGINVEGESLSQIIIFRLPFPAPDPILNYKMSLAADPVNDVCVPEMILKLKQGAGRLIRCATDTGIVSILDPRISMKDRPYAERAVHALSVKEQADTMIELQNFRKEIMNGKVRNC